jgi:hypothetical protein
MAAKPKCTELDRFAIKRRLHMTEPVELPVITETKLAANGLIDALVEFEDWHDGDATFILVGPATFRRDFGPWKKGEVVDTLSLDYSRGVLEEHNERGDLVRRVAVCLAIDVARTDTGE